MRRVRKKPDKKASMKASTTEGTKATRKVEENPWVRILPKGYLSPSSVDVYLKCPHAFELRYVMGFKSEEVGSNRVQGSAIHKAIERGDEDWSKAWGEMKEDITEWEEKEDEIKKRISVFQGLYEKDPVEAEEVEIQVKGEVGGIPAEGYVDAKVDGGIVDYKVVKRAKTLLEVEKGIQFGVYSLLTGVDSVEAYCFVKTKVPQVKRVKGVRTKKSNERVAEVFRGVAEGIKKGSFPVCAPDAWNCCERYCDMWRYCRNGGGSK